MRHEYDWTFHTPQVGPSGSEPTTLVMSSKQTRIAAGSHPLPAPQPPGKIAKDDEDDGSGATIGSTVLTTAMRLQHTPLTVVQLLWRLLVLPWLTVLIQIWIHIEAAAILSKGIPLFEHPTGAQTCMTRTIEILATPLLWLLASGEEKPPPKT
jgi:hypothetical protein